MHTEKIWETLVISRGWKPDKEGRLAIICAILTLFEFLLKKQIKFGHLK